MGRMAAVRAWAGRDLVGIGAVTGGLLGRSIRPERFVSLDVVRSM